ncbi:MAG: helix-turn-helix domain-containing protein [Cyanobium sp.]
MSSKRCKAAGVIPVFAPSRAATPWTIDSCAVIGAAVSTHLGPDDVLCRVARRLSPARAPEGGTRRSDALPRPRRANGQQLQGDGQRPSVKAVALLCGYNQPGHFAKDFKQLFGISPGEARRR